MMTSNTTANTRPSTTCKSTAGSLASTSAPLLTSTLLPVAALLLAVTLVGGCATGDATTADDTSVATAPRGNGTEALLLEGDRVALLWVNGMGCPLCANNVDRQLRQLDGVERVTVDLGTGLITAHLAEDARPTRQQLERAVTNSGFTMVRAEVSP